MKNYYEILGVKSNATFEEIKKAYEKNRYKVKDIYELEEIDEIYHVLSNHNRRIAYNNQLLHHDTVFFDDKNGSVNVSQKEINEALNDLVRDEPVKGIPKPLDRYDFEYYIGLSDKDSVSPKLYEDYLKNYWEIVEHEQDVLEGYIDGTNIAKPINRYDFETKLGLNNKENISPKLYESYLEGYYTRAFAKKEEPAKDDESDKELEKAIQEKIDEELGKRPKQEEVVQEDDKKPRLVTKILKNKRLKKIITIGLLAGALVLSVLGLKSCKQNENNLPKEPEITNVQDNDDEKITEPEQIVNQAFNEEQAQNEDKTFNVGTSVYLDQGIEFYNSSIDPTVTGYIGNEYTEPSVYTIDKVVVIDNNTKEEVANSAQSQIDINNYNNTNYTVMTHFSENVTKEDIENNRVEQDSSKNIGWVNINNLSKDKITGNILEDSMKTR